MNTQTLPTRLTTLAIAMSMGLSLLSMPSLALAQVASTPAPITADVASLTTTAIPPRMEISGKPGETIQKTIKIENNATTIQYYSSSVEDFIVGADGTTPIPVTENITSRYSLASWVTISPTRFVLKPNEAQVMDVLIQIPKDALPGGHYAMVLHQPAGSSHKPGEALLAQGSTGIAMRVGSLLYLTVAGPVHEEAFIRNFTAPSLVEFGPVTMKYDVENRSDVHIRPQSSIEIRDLFGRLMDTIKPDEFNIFPFTSRSFTGTYERYWGLGRYTAKLVVPYGSHGNVTTALLAFWIIPYRIIVGILLLIASIVAIAILIRRYRLHHSDEKTLEIEALKKKVEELEDKHDENVVR